MVARDCTSTNGNGARQKADTEFALMAANVIGFKASRISALYDRGVIFASAASMV
jgi:hypothetical protein